MIDKIVRGLADGLAGIQDGAIAMIGGSGPAGHPSALIEALVEQDARDLVVIANNAGAGRVRRTIFRRSAGSVVFEDCSHPPTALASSAGPTPTWQWLRSRRTASR